MPAHIKALEGEYPIEEFTKASALEVGLVGLINITLRVIAPIYSWARYLDEKPVFNVYINQQPIINAVHKGLLGKWRRGNFRYRSGGADIEHRQLWATLSTLMLAYDIVIQANPMKNRAFAQLYNPLSVYNRLRKKQTYNAKYNPTRRQSARAAS